jgi:hypothetical protein
MVGVELGEHCGLRVMTLSGDFNKRENMKLQTVTLYTIVGISFGIALSLSQFPWG